MNMKRGIHSMHSRLSNNHGFTLAELMIVLGIGGLIIASVFAIMYQLFGITTTNTNYLAAFRQVQNSGNWISRDALMAQKVIVDDPDTFVTIEWATWEGERHQVDYTLEDMTSGQLKKLRRTHSIDGSPAETIVIGECIKLSETDSKWDADKKELIVVITAQVGEYGDWRLSTWANTVTRTYRVQPRPLF